MKHLNTSGDTFYVQLTPTDREDFEAHEVYGISEEKKVCDAQGMPVDEAWYDLNWNLFDTIVETAQESKWFN